MGMQGLAQDDFYMEAVSEDSASIFSDFSCGNDEIDRYFREQAKGDRQKVCYAYRCRHDKNVVGLATLCCSGINIDSYNLVQLMPAMKIDYFAVSEKYQDMPFPDSNPDDHFFVSDAFLSELINEAHNISTNCIGASCIILYSVPDAVHFYERNEFEQFRNYMKPENSRYLEGCEPMYLPF